MFPALHLTNTKKRSERRIKRSTSTNTRRANMIKRSLERRRKLGAAASPNWNPDQLLALK